MIGCSQHRSKEDPDTFAEPSTHMALHIRAVLVDGNVLGHAPSHCVKRHTSHEFGLCHMWFSPCGTVSPPLSPCPMCFHTWMVHAFPPHWKNTATYVLYMQCHFSWSYGHGPNHVPAPGRAKNSRWSWISLGKTSHPVLFLPQICVRTPHNIQACLFHISMPGGTQWALYTHFHTPTLWVRVWPSIWRAGGNGE